VSVVSELRLSHLIPPRLRAWLTRHVARYLSAPIPNYRPRGRNDFDRMKQCIRKGDVVLVEGNQRVSAVIRYLTQSCWSHAALYIGDELLRRDDALRDQALDSFGDDAQHLVVDALFDGVVVTPLASYVEYNVRVCRPHRLRAEHLKTILDEAVGAIGSRYDLRNVLDLAGHLIRVSLLPGRDRETALRFGSGDSGQVICTSLLGKLFHKVRFPVLPSVTFPPGQAPAFVPPRRTPLGWLKGRPDPYHGGLYRSRHSTLLTPRDFDLSPYFNVVKFNVVPGRAFDYSRIEWVQDPAGDEVA
jgi:hypothetical protein